MILAAPIVLCKPPDCRDIFSGLICENDVQQYQCFFIRYVGEVAELVVIEARNDAHAMILADDHLANHPKYRSVEIFQGDRRVAAFQSNPAADDLQSGTFLH